MDKGEARELALSKIRDLRLEPYGTLVSAYEGHTVHSDVTGPSGTNYCLDVEAFWDTPDVPGNLRVMVVVDPGPRGGLRRVLPRSVVTEDFIIAPDGSFVGE